MSTIKHRSTGVVAHVPDGHWATTSNDWEPVEPKKQQVKRQTRTRTRATK